jgi:hypothetical protein
MMPQVSRLLSEEKTGQDIIEIDEFLDIFLTVMKPWAKICPKLCTNVLLDRSLVVTLLMVASETLHPVNVLDYFHGIYSSLPQSEDYTKEAIQTSQVYWTSKIVELGERAFSMGIWSNYMAAMTSLASFAHFIDEDFAKILVRFTLGKLGKVLPLPILGLAETLVHVDGVASILDLTIPSILETNLELEILLKLAIIWFRSRPQVHYSDIPTKVVKAIRNSLVSPSLAQDGLNCIKHMPIAETVQFLPEMVENLKSAENRDAAMPLLQRLKEFVVVPRFGIGKAWFLDVLGESINTASKKESARTQAILYNCLGQLEY